MKSVFAIIETPKGGHEKYNYDQVSGFFKLKKILPQGMCFPYDFGFVPNTKGEDGDPLDIIVISEFKSFTGCMSECRLVGCIHASQIEKNSRKEIQNDRYIAIPVISDLFRHVKSISDLPAKVINELQYFFINYNKVEGKQFKVTGLSGPGKSIQLLRKNSSETTAKLK